MSLCVYTIFLSKKFLFYKTLILFLGNLNFLFDGFCVFWCFFVCLFVIEVHTDIIYYYYYSLYSNEEFKFFFVDKILYFIVMFLVPVNCLYCLKFRHHFTIPAIIFLAFSFLGQFSSLF